MTEQVRVLEGERMAAFEAAAAARADVAQLKIEQKRLQWQRQLLEQMSEVRLPLWMLFWFTCCPRWENLIEAPTCAGTTALSTAA